MRFTILLTALLALSAFVNDASASPTKSRAPNYSVMANKVDVDLNPLYIGNSAVNPLFANDAVPCAQQAAQHHAPQGPHFCHL